MKVNINDRRLRMSTKWHRWFAWFPVKIANEIVWLESIERKGGYDHSKNTGRQPPWRWEYRNTEAGA